MQKLLTIALLGISAFAARAERVDIGGYFSINIPPSWRPAESGMHVNGPGTYTLYEAYSYSCYMSIDVVNPPLSPGAITLADYRGYDDAMLTALATDNHRVGWSRPVVAKDDVNGIPVLFFRQRRGKVRFLEMDLWVAEKRFVIKFVYTPAAIKTINAMIESTQPGNFAAPAVATPQPATDPAILEVVGQET
jgi:hypothetical protein